MDKSFCYTKEIRYSLQPVRFTLADMMKQRQNLIDVFLEKNSQINLSAIRDADGVYHKHILDSLELSKVISFTPGSTLADIGTGGGFPLLPLASTYPEVKFVGVDARKKKTIAVQEMADSLGLKNVSTLRSRAEDITERYDYVTSRAVGYATKIILWSVPLVKKGGYLILYKQLTPEEDDLIFDLAQRHKLSLHKLHHYKLFDGDVQRIIYVFRKL